MTTKTTEETEKHERELDREDAKRRKAHRAEQLEEMAATAHAFGDEMRRVLGLDAFSERYLVATERQAAALETIGRELALTNMRELGRRLEGRAPVRTSPAPTRVVDDDLEDDDPIASPAERAVVRRAPAVIAKHMNQNQNRRRNRNR
jgi:hypothetical protein